MTATDTIILVALVAGGAAMTPVELDQAGPIGRPGAA